MRKSALARRERVETDRHANDVAVRSGETDLPISAEEVRIQVSVIAPDDRPEFVVASPSCSVRARNPAAPMCLRLAQVTTVQRPTARATSDASAAADWATGT